jgi:hypothetical protein
LEYSVATAGKQPFRKLNTHRLRILNASFNAIANELFTVYTGYQSFQSHPCPDYCRMRRDRNLTTSLEPMEQRTFCKNGCLARRMVQAAQQRLNKEIVSPALDTQRPLANGRQTNLRGKILCNFMRPGQSPEPGCGKYDGVELSLP